MNLLSTLIQRITTLVVVLVVAFSANAADRTFATLAEMNADATLAENDKVTIQGDLVVEYIVSSTFVLRDKDGTATCVNYNYYFNELQKNRVLLDMAPVKPGDVFKNYTAVVNYSNDLLQLNPDLNKNTGVFNGFTEEPSTTDYTANTTKVTVRQLLDTPEEYFGKVVSLDNVTTFSKGFNYYLVQGTDTLKNFRIYGLDTYPSSLVINKALCSKQYDGSCKLELTIDDYSVQAFTEIKAVKSSGKTENLPLDLTAQVVKKETYNGKTYISIKDGAGRYLVNYSGIRVLLNAENENDKNIKIGDIINLKAKNAKLDLFNKTVKATTLSLLTVEEHEITILSNEEINYLPIAPEEISMLNYYECLPVIVDGFVTTSGTPTDEQKAHNISPAVVESNYGETYNVLLDVTYMPKTGSRFVVSGVLDIPLWMGSSNKTTIVPTSEKSFMATEYEFDNIAEMVEFGQPITSIVHFRINSAMTITGIDSISPVGDEDPVQHVVFVTDQTGSLMLSGFVPYRVGEAITAVGGYYSEYTPSSVSNEGIMNFGVARYMRLDTLGVRRTQTTNIEPVEVTIAQLLEGEEYVSKLVKLTNFTYKEVEEFVQDETVRRYFIYQGSDSIAVATSFANQEDKTTLVGNFYLNGFYTQVIPYDFEKATSVKVDNIEIDNKLFVQNNTLYAIGAEIEVYDITGRLLAKGANSVVLDNISVSAVLIVKTSYDGTSFVTKVVNR
jgi:hypothetical protein